MGVLIIRAFGQRRESGHGGFKRLLAEMAGWDLHSGPPDSKPLLSHPLSVVVKLVSFAVALESDRLGFESCYPLPIRCVICSELLNFF